MRDDLFWTVVRAVGLILNGLMALVAQGRLAAFHGFMAGALTMTFVADWLIFDKASDYNEGDAP